MEESYPRIEDYLDNALTDTERAAFEAEVQADPALAAALGQLREARERLARQWAQESAEVNLRKTLDGLGKQHFESAALSGKITRRVLVGRWWMAAAAAVAALVVWLAWPPDENALYEHYRAFPEASFTMRSSEAQTLGDASKAFNDKNFIAALTLLNNYLQQQPTDIEARFFSGLCQLELGRLAEAEATFRQIISTDNAWTGEARWYLALAYLRNRKKEECSVVLRQIQPTEAHYAAARELLNKL